MPHYADAVLIGKLQYIRKYGLRSVQYTVFGQNARDVGVNLKRETVRLL